jgi:hypothetical protein
VLGYIKSNNKSPPKTFIITHTNPQTTEEANEMIKEFAEKSRKPGINTRIIVIHFKDGDFALDLRDLNHLVEILNKHGVEIKPGKERFPTKKKK